MSSREALSLKELNTMIREVISDALPATSWVRSEISDVRVNGSSGHCYLEFIEKDEKTGQIIAKARGTIWARTFHTLKSYFENETGQPLSSGLKVLVNVSVDFHELYGYSLSVYDIDPSYTLGDMVKKRQEIVRRLQEEGIFELNKELLFPSIPHRIAVVTSSTAAGYEDFIHQLTGNEFGFPFYIKLFPATMQGDRTEESVIAALDRIFPHTDLFDVVVIIRGGGSTSELSSFDSYPLAANCAQFPLPVITGIGHERDDTALDMVAHTRLKTPTAVAAFLIDRMKCEAAQVQELEYRIGEKVSAYVLLKKSALQTLTAKFSVTVIGYIEQRRKHLHAVTAFMSSLPRLIHHRTEKLYELHSRLQRATDMMIFRNATLIAGIPARLHRAVGTVCAERRQDILLKEQYVKMVSPEYVLKRGYTLTCKNGRIVKLASDLTVSDEIIIKFMDGEKKGVII